MRSGEVGSDAGRGRLPGRTGPTIVALIALAAGGAGIGPQPARAQEPAKPAAEKAPEAKPADTVTAEKGRFEVVFEAKGDFDPVDSALVQLKAQQWAQPLEIMRIVPHGTRVNAGDVLVEFDTEKLDRAIADLEVDLAVGEKTLEIARRELPVTEALQPLELAQAERDTLAATEDLARYLAIGRTLAEDSARFRLKASEEQLKYAREELRQLEKMYKDKDLTEETEEMILQRTRFDVESGEFNLRRAGVDTEAALTFEVPRKEATLKDAAEKAKLALEKTRATSGITLEQKRLALKKAERDRVEALRKLRDLQQDRAGIPLKAPRSGIVYYGKQHDGAWTTSVVAAKAAVGQGVPVGDLVFTVVDPARVAFRVKVDEKDLHLLAPGLKGGGRTVGLPRHGRGDRARVGVARPARREGRCPLQCHGARRWREAGARDDGKRPLPGLLAPRCGDPAGDGRLPRRRRQEDRLAAGQGWGRGREARREDRAHLRREDGDHRGDRRRRCRAFEPTLIAWG